MWTLFWNSILLACVGTLFLRIAGRKSISQMSTPQFVVLLTLGTVIGTEVSGKGLGKTITVLGTFILFLIVIEWVTLRSNRLETILKGKAVTVIQDGKLVVNHLQKHRISVDDLKKRLRIANISRIEDVKSGTIEDNGEFGYELTSQAKPVTRGDLEKFIKVCFPQVKISYTSDGESIFTEVNEGSHHDKIPEQLQ